MCALCSGMWVPSGLLARCLCFNTIGLLLTQAQQSVSVAFEKMMKGGHSVVDLWRLTVYESTPSVKHTFTHPSASKFITLHHLPTCSVMTFSQFHKNPGKPVGVNQCRPPLRLLRTSIIKVPRVIFDKSLPAFHWQAYTSLCVYVHLSPNFNWWDE